jgi:ABC-type multidrug transport system fused ATPase/permease subunit
MTPGEQRKGFFIALGLLAASLVDTVALIGVMPLVSLIIEPEVLQTNATIARIHGFLGAPTFERFILIMAAGAIGLVAASVTMNLAMQLVTKRYRISCQDRLARDLITKCIRAPYAWLLRQNSTTLAHYVFNDVLGWSSGGINGIMSVIAQSTLLILVVGVVLSTAALPGLAGLLVIGVIAFAIMQTIRPSIRRLSEFHRTAAAQSFSFASEFLGGIKDVKLSGRDEVFVDGYQRTFNTYGEAMGTLKVLQAIPPLVLMFLGQAAIITIALILWSIGKTSGEIAGDMALVLLVTARAVPATTRLAGEIANLWNVVPNIEGIHSIHGALSAEPEIITGPDAEAAAQRFADWQHMTFEQVGYQYSSGRETALIDISLRFTRGNSYGIVGPTGSGKTTLVDLALGLLQPINGRVLVDDVPLGATDATVWQRSIGYVPQNPLIADDTLLANVALGVPTGEADRPRAELCLRQANLSDILESVGLDGPLGERGNRLSGGQRQRIAIARSLYDQPTILILDEATSALDTISEQAIQRAIESLHGSVTTITIAHRLSTIRHCDEILVLEGGRIVAQGDFDGLLNESALFRLLAAQLPATASAVQPTN